MQFPKFLLLWAPSLGRRGYHFHPSRRSLQYSTPLFVVQCSSGGNVKSGFWKMRGIKTFILLLVLLFGPFISLGKYIEGKWNATDDTGLLTSSVVGCPLVFQQLWTDICKLQSRFRRNQLRDENWRESWEKESLLPHLLLTIVSHQF